MEVMKDGRPHELVQLPEIVTEHHQGESGLPYTSIYKYECSACGERFQKKHSSPSCAIARIEHVERMAITYGDTPPEQLEQVVDIALRRQKWPKYERERFIREWQRWRTWRALQDVVCSGLNDPLADVTDRNDPAYTVKCTTCLAEPCQPCMPQNSPVMTPRKFPHTPRTTAAKHAKEEPAPPTRRKVKPATIVTATEPYVMRCPLCRKTPLTGLQILCRSCARARDAKYRIQGELN